MEKRFTMIRASHYVLLRIMFTATPGEKLCFSGGAKSKETASPKYKNKKLDFFYQLGALKSRNSTLFSRVALF